jgi:hypothetical protein
MKGENQYIRGYWLLQELTDEAVIAGMMEQ